MFARLEKWNMNQKSDICLSLGPSVRIIFRRCLYRSVCLSVCLGVTNSSSVFSCPYIERTNTTQMERARDFSLAFAVCSMWDWWMEYYIGRMNEWKWCWWVRWELTCLREYITNTHTHILHIHASGSAAAEDLHVCESAPKSKVRFPIYV